MQKLAVMYNCSVIDSKLSMINGRSDLSKTCHPHPRNTSNWTISLPEWLILKGHHQRFHHRRLIYYSIPKTMKNHCLVMHHKSIIQTLHHHFYHHQIWTRQKLELFTTRHHQKINARMIRQCKTLVEYKWETMWMKIKSFHH